MDIDDLLAAVNCRLSGAGERQPLSRVVERAVRRRLGALWVSIRPHADVESPPDQDAEAAVVRIAIPLRPGARRLDLAFLPDPDRSLSADDGRYAERAALVYAIVAEADVRERAAALCDARVRDGAAPLIGHSPAMHALRERIARVASTDFTVLIEGESGSGKELVARQIHELSGRRRGPFVAINCAAIVDTLLESELFGIEDRTATGVRGRQGKFELASGGTLFLDEVGDLSASAQAKLLRAIQDFAVERVGGSLVRQIDLRLIVATNRHLHDLVARGEFRQDLYYRLSGVELWVPPLRTRREDVAELARYFLERHRAIRHLELSAAAVDALSAYDWPGNVRELERLIESILALAAGPRLDVDDLPLAFRGRYLDILQPSLQQRDSLREWARRYVRLVLQRCGGNKRQACRELGISYHTLQAYLRHPVRHAQPDQTRGPAAPAATVHETAAFGADGTRAAAGLHAL